MADCDNCRHPDDHAQRQGAGVSHACIVVGMEDGLFPGDRAMGEQEEMEEERRLCYVAMTRAKEKLTLTNARQRTLYGQYQPRYALPLSEGDPGGEYGVAGEARTPAGGVPLGGGVAASCRCVSGTYPSGGDQCRSTTAPSRSVGAGSLRSTPLRP